jgi:ABC-type multidrug transport system fused ATPase/permease subunit
MENFFSYDMSCSISSITFFLTRNLRKGIIIGRKIWENAGGIAKEMLYNIKTVASFANFEYELQRFYEKVEIVWMIDLMNAFKLGLINGIIVFLLFLDLFLCFIYGRTLIKKDYNAPKGRDLSRPDVFASGLCTLIGLSSINIIGPNIKVIQESCAAASDYFNLLNRKTQMDYSQSIERPPLSQFQGKIEFCGVNFHFPSDPEKN